MFVLKTVLVLTAIAQYLRNLIFPPKPTCISCGVTFIPKSKLSVTPYLIKYIKPGPTIYSSDISVQTNSTPNVLLHSSLEVVFIV